jgi:hypothetical protein
MNGHVMNQNEVSQEVLALVQKRMTETISQMADREYEDDVAEFVALGVPYDEANELVRQISRAVLGVL